MRTLAIGDIHGCRASLEALANYVGFESTDTVVTLGDYVDRGPDSKGVIDFLLEVGKNSHLVTLRGNHKVMMLESRDTPTWLTGWLGVGGDSTIQSYGTCFEDVPESHWEFLHGTLPYHEMETHFFVHACARHDTPLDEQDPDDLYWTPFYRPKPHCSGKVMVCGHTAQRRGKPKNVEHAVCIDTHAFAGKWLTCLDVGSGIYFQANEKGECRSDVLS